MLVNIAIGTSIAGIVVALFSVIILFLTRKNILDILQKDVILFDKNFELKKQAIEKSFIIADESIDKNDEDKEFVDRAMACYNELLCVVSDVKIASYFHYIAIDNKSTTSLQVAQYKIACRHDIGLETKGIKLTIPTKSNNKPNNKPAQTPVKEEKPQVKFEESIEEPIQEPVVEQPNTNIQPTPQPTAVRPQNITTQQVRPQQLVRPMQAHQRPQATMQRPVQPMTQTARPQPSVAPTQQTAVRRGRPPKDN